MSATSELEAVREKLRGSDVASAHPDLAARLDELPAEPSEVASVVVVGEKKRGKSSLINALLRRPGLFPVDVDIATACYLGATAGETDRAIAYGDEAPDGRPIELSEISAWASVEGNRVAGSQPPKALHPGVTAVTVELPHPLLEAGLVVIDTPGVGGLEAGHAEVTMAILRNADSMLFVVDPDSGLRQSELAFLAAATQRIAQVAFVMTKVDRYPSWRDVLAENRARLANAAPRWAESPWYDVSSLIAYDAIEAEHCGDRSEAESLWAESGFDRLERYLAEEVSGRADALRLANDAFQLRSLVDDLAEAEQLSLAAAGGDPALRARLGEQQAALGAMLADDARWPTTLHLTLEELKRSLQKEFRTHLRSARSDLHDQLTAGRLPLAQLPNEIDARLRAIWLELNGSLGDKAAAVVVLLAGEIADDGSDALVRELEFPERLKQLPPLAMLTDGERDFGETLDEYMPVLFSAGGAAALLSGALALVNPLAAIAIGVGAGMARRNAQVAKRQLATDRAAGISYVQRTFEQAADDMGEDLQRAVVETQQRCEAEVRGLMEKRRLELETQVRTLKQQVRADEATEATLRKQTEQRLAELAELRAAIAAVEAG